MIVNEQEIELKEHSSKRATTQEMKRGRLGDWDIPGAAVSRNYKSYNVSAALPSRRLLCYLNIYADGP